MIYTLQVYVLVAIAVTVSVAAVFGVISATVVAWNGAQRIARNANRPLRATHDTSASLQ